jgi:hypothetical protein
MAAKIKPLYLTHNTYYLTSNVTKVVKQHQISIMFSTGKFYIGELVNLPVLTAQPWFEWLLTAIQSGFQSFSPF